MVIGRRRRRKSKKVTGEPSVEEETDGRRVDEADERTDGRKDRGNGRCLPLPNDVGRIQNGRVAADADGRPDGLSHGRLSKRQGQGKRGEERRRGSQAGLDGSLERE